MMCVLKLILRSLKINLQIGKYNRTLYSVVTMCIGSVVSKTSV